MNRFLAPVIALSVIGIGIGVALNLNAPRQSKLPKAPSASMSELGRMELAVSAPISHDGVTIVPITSSRPPSQTADYVTLDVAQKNGWVEVSEQGTTDYNGAMITNKGPKPILVMAGDLIVGGHQDRVVAHDVVIQPGETKDIEVYCVEEGRGTGPTDVFTVADVPVPHRVRREAMFARNQSRVWGAVSAFNAMASAAPPTKTVQGGLSDKRVQKFVQSNSTTIAEKLVGTKGAIGFAVIVNGQVDTIELFGNEKLLKSAAPRLLKGIAADQSLANRTGSAPSADAVAAYTLAALKGSRTAERSVDGSHVYRVVSREATRGYELYSAKNGAEDRIGYLIHGTYRN